MNWGWSGYYDNWFAFNDWAIYGDNFEYDNAGL